MCACFLKDESIEDHTKLTWFHKTLRERYRHPVQDGAVVLSSSRISTSPGVLVFLDREGDEAAGDCGKSIGSREERLAMAALVSLSSTQLLRPCAVSEQAGITQFVNIVGKVREGEGEGELGEAGGCKDGDEREGCGTKGDCWSGASRTGVGEDVVVRQG